MTPPIALTDSELHELRQIAETIPWDLRPDFLERVAAKLQGQDIGDGVVHRVCRAVSLACIRVPRLSPIGNRRNRPAAAENAANFFRRARGRRKKA